MVKSASPIGLKNYLGMLGWQSPPDPTLANLALLQQKHTAVFPFQTLTTVMRLPVSLSFSELEQKVLLGNQGGYCYELNLLFACLLSGLGYQAELIAAYVIHDSYTEQRSPRTHALVKVTFGNEIYIADVGHGGLTPTAPLAIEETGIQTTPHGQYSVLGVNGSYVLRMLLGEKWYNLYGFDLRPQHPSDTEVGNWYVSTHPDSHFRTTLMVARTDDNGQRHALLNNRYTLYTAGKPDIRREFNNANDILEAIRDTFGLRVPDPEGAKTAIEPLLRAS